MKGSLTREQKKLIQWRQRLIRLPESIFLDLIRNYLGEVRTPFNKQDLLGRLEVFLNKDDSRLRIVALLTLADRHLLSAITMLNDCTEEKLYALVGAGRSFLDFHLHLLNLEDRLLVFREESDGGLWLNPLLATALTPFLSQSLVVPSLEMDEDPQIWPLWLDDSCLAALFCFINERGDLITSQGGLKKRAAEDFQKRFAGLASLLALPPAELQADGSWSVTLPDAESEEDAASPAWAKGQPANSVEQQQADRLKSALLLALAAFRNLGLARSTNASLQVVFERWLELAGLEAGQRRWMVWAAALVPESSVLNHRSSEFFIQSRISQFARTLCLWLGTIHGDQGYSRSALTTLWGINANQELPSPEINRIIDGLGLLGILLPHRDGWYLNPACHSVGDPIPTGMPPAAPLVLTPAFELQVTGGLPLDELLTLACCTSLQKQVPVTSLALTRDSVQGGFSRGIAAADLIDLLARHSGRPVPQNVHISIEEWYRDWQSIQVVDGIAILAQGTRAAQISHLIGLESFILAQPAPGVFILDRQAIAEWRPLLVAGGIPEQTLPSVDSLQLAPAALQGTFLPPLASLDLEGLAIPAREADTGDLTPGMDIAPPLGGAFNRQELVEELRRTLDALDLGPEVHEELAKRINNGLILAPSQLSAATVRLERSEAGGLDYTAKLRILEQAIKTKRDFVEITQHAEHGSAYKLLVWPLKIRQVGNELALSAQTLPAGKELSLLVSKILLVRRIRASIFS